MEVNIGENPVPFSRACWRENGLQDLLYIGGFHTYVMTTLWLTPARMTYDRTITNNHFFWFSHPKVQNNISQKCLIEESEWSHNLRPVSESELGFFFLKRRGLYQEKKWMLCYPACPDLLDLVPSCITLCCLETGCVKTHSWRHAVAASSFGLPEARIPFARYRMRTVAQSCQTHNQKHPTTINLEGTTISLEGTTITLEGTTLILEETTIILWGTTLQFPSICTMIGHFYFVFVPNFVFLLLNVAQSCQTHNQKHQQQLTWKEQQLVWKQQQLFWKEQHYNFQVSLQCHGMYVSCLCIFLFCCYLCQNQQQKKSAPVKSCVLYKLTRWQDRLVGKVMGCLNSPICTSASVW